VPPTEDDLDQVLAHLTVDGAVAVDVRIRIAPVGAVEQVVRELPS
jgi:hypothetical protein